MLEKIAGVALVNKMRAILLMEGDYNYFNSPLWSVDLDTGAQGPVWQSGTSSVISSFGEDEQGEIYACDHTGGRLLRLEVN